MSRCRFKTRRALGRERVVAAPRRARLGWREGESHGNTEAAPGTARASPTLVVPQRRRAVGAVVWRRCSDGTNTSFRLGRAGAAPRARAVAQDRGEDRRPRAVSAGPVWVWRRLHRGAAGQPNGGRGGKKQVPCGGAIAARRGAVPGRTARPRGPSVCGATAKTSTSSSTMN